MATTWDASIAKGQAALDALYALTNAAMQSGNVAAQKALEDDVDDLTYKLTQLRSLAVDEDANQVTALNAQLDSVTTAAKASLANLDQLSTVLNNVVTAAKLLDSIIAVAAKI